VPSMSLWGRPIVAGDSSECGPGFGFRRDPEPKGKRSRPTQKGSSPTNNCPFIILRSTARVPVKAAVD
jgi:hypothetical protein